MASPWASWARWCCSSSPGGSGENESASKQGCNRSEPCEKQDEGIVSMVMVIRGRNAEGSLESSGNTRRDGCLSGTGLRRVRNLALEPQSHSWVCGRRFRGRCHTHPVCRRSGEEVDGNSSIVAVRLARHC